MCGAAMAADWKGMGMSRRFTTCATVVGMAVLVAASVQARPAECLLEVGAQTYIDGPCDFRSLDEGSGSFQITSADQSYFAFLYVEGADGGTAYWNEIAGASHAHTPLGALTRDGACWVNTATRICATSER